MEVQIAIESQDQLGEGPVWDGVNGQFYWVDILGQTLQRWDPRTQDRKTWILPSDIGSFALRHSGAVVALRSGIANLDFETGTVTPWFDPESDLDFTRFNDGKCDRQGRFWAGTMDEGGAQRGALYRIDQDHSYKKIRPKVGISNGLGWSPDNSIFYYTDSFTHTIYSYDFDTQTGEISNERVFARTPAEYVPDGLTVDADGYIWSANWDGWKIIRYAPDGKKDCEVAIPVQRPTSCIFGGPYLNDLYITTAGVGLTEEELGTQPLAGSVFVIRNAGRGLPEPYFGG
jgi:L-arabinonolactonase